ncbi:MAG: CDP-alcohol phosphatidyltransferase family protein [Alphaproteobacteria bacterium]
MTLYAVKPRFQALLRPLVGRLARAGVTANAVTVAATIGSIAAGALAAAAGGAAFLLVPAWMAVRMALNAIDGMLAREHGQASRLGAYLNEIGDLVSDAALYAPFALLAPFGPAAIAAVILLAWLAEIAGILGPTIGASRRYDGPFGKSDRALVFGALGLWVGIGGALPDWTGWLVPAMALLLVATTIRRGRAALAEAGGR